MKKFNLQLIFTLTSILLLQGCMPDSLSKFQKDPPKKAAPPAAIPPPSPEKLTEIKYSQSDKLLLSVTPDLGKITDILPTRTDTGSLGVDYDRYNIISGENTATGIVKYVDSSLNKIGINKLLALYVHDVNKFIKNHYISVVGNDKKVGKIFSIDDTYGILYVENISKENLSFSTGDRISNNTTGTSEASYIIEVDDSYIMNDTNIDNDSLYFSSKYKVTDQINVYQTGESYTIKPLSPILNDSLSMSNGVSYKISPAVPSGIAFDPATGVISGAFKSDLSPTKYTITATNKLGSVSTSLYLSSITAPLDYSITNKQIVTVTNTALFREGEDLFQPIVPPLTQASSARILKILNGYKMAIEVYNGTFLAGAVLDSGSSYISQKATIIPDNSCTNSNYKTKESCESSSSRAWSPGPIYFNLTLTASASGFEIGDTITNSSGSGAKALIAGLVTIPAPTHDILFVKYLTGEALNPTSAEVFSQGDSIYRYGSISSSGTIDQIENSFLKLTLNANSNAANNGFVKGADIVSNAGSSAYTYYIDPTDTKIISISDIATTGAGTGFITGQRLYNNESSTLPTSAPLTTIASLTFDNLLVFERGKQSEFHGDISAGNGITYSITPALPPGLTLDTANGSISGTATSSMERNDFLITATNFISSVTFTTSIEVRDYFQIADKSATTSFILHKVGETQVNRKCRINASDINNAATDTKVLDIRCFLDAEEEDLYFNKLKLNGLSGPGVCEYIQYDPYYFQQFSPLQSAGTSIKTGGYPTPVVVDLGCQPNNVNPPTPDLCDSYYTTNAHPEYPNCDEGYLSYTERVFSMVGAVCSATPTVTEKRVYCGGTIAKCTAGPITSLLSLESIELGHRGMVYNTPNGLDKTWEISAPNEKPRFTNIVNANGSVVNTCTGSNADADTWENETLKQSGYFSPLGAGLSVGASNEYRFFSNPYYSFYCLDAAKEIKARIRLVVRDWDRSFKINNHIDDDVPTNLPYNLMNLLNDKTGNPFNVAWNSYKDWDDDYNGVASSNATYTGGACGAHPSGCSNGTDLTPTTCITNGGTWTSACNGTITYNSKYLCELNGYRWIAASCTGSGVNSEYLCNLIGADWSSDSEYKFPEGNL